MVLVCVLKNRGSSNYWYT